MKSKIDTTLKASQSTEASDQQIQLGKRKRESESEDKKDDKRKAQKSEINSVCSGAHDLMLAKNYDPAKPELYKGWLMSEKLDGVRCFWNGKTLYSRNGKEFWAPDWFKKDLPDNLALDGELWTKRDDFQNCVGIVKTQDTKNEKWKEIIYKVYDAPLLVKHSFKQRLEIMEQVIKPLNSKYVEIHEQNMCQSTQHLDQKMDEVIALKGEGLMLKDPNSKYEQRRSDRLVKVKKFDDTEATVIGHIKGTGRCTGMLGALQVRMSNGIEFKIGSGFTDAQRRSPPKIGRVVTFKYQGLTKANVPRFPIYMRDHPGV